MALTATHRMQKAGTCVIAKGGSVNNAERQHLGKLAALGCIACRHLGFIGTPAEIHHLRDGAGMAQKTSHFEAIPLCPIHHRGTAGLKFPSIHMSKHDFIATFGTERELLEEVLSLI
ncbi:MAG TPA: Ref family recombination enhancement nuclease [Cellvibrionaceae bacterium]|nr:Ref family recombination enhancement nuclease [Cellvibrionaceae bacterium]